MKLNISPDILQVYKSALKRLDKMAEERYQSAIDLRLRVANMLDTIDKFENPEPPEWLSPLETPSEGSRKEFNMSTMSLDTETDSGDNDPSEPSEEYPEDEEENPPAPPMPEEEPEYNIDNLLEDISKTFVNRREDPYAICKNARMQNSEIDIWQALVRVINTLSSSLGNEIAADAIMASTLMQYAIEYGELKNTQLR